MYDSRHLFPVAAVGLLVACVWVVGAAAGDRGKNMKDKSKLTPEEARVIVNKGTEHPFTGKYLNNKADGTYTCRRCGAPLFESGAKFDSGSGWPSFDQALPGAVKEVPDPDGMRVEIQCAKCGAHLGHVFRGEGFTRRNTRHCVNSVSLDFAPRTDETAPAAKGVAFFAGGCFWGVEHLFEKEPGVLSAVSGYMGGRVDKPTYEQVCSHTTGHVETVKVVFDPAKTNYEKLARLFFEIHDPTQVDRQGPDVGEQYRSVVFFSDGEQKKIAQKLIAALVARGYEVATRVQPAATFWPAEDYHQDYYERTGKTPYCHSRTDRFGD